MSNTHVIIDIETLSTNDDAVVWSIGAVKKCFDTGAELDTFYIRIDQNQGGHVDDGTLYWWAQQNQEAQAEMYNRDYAPVEVALEAFRTWLDGKHKVWGNGATFDLVKIRRLYERYGQDAPWDFWDERDVRTVVDMCPTNHKKLVPFIGIQHHALYDARHEAHYTFLSWQELTR